MQLTLHVAYSIPSRELNGRSTSLNCPVVGHALCHAVDLKHFSNVLLFYRLFKTMQASCKRFAAKEDGTFLCMRKEEHLGRLTTEFTNAQLKCGT